MDHDSHKSQTRSIVALGNLLLDTVVPVSEDFLAKRGLELDTTTLATSDQHFSMFKELQEEEGGDFAVNYCAGGCAANTIRVAQWIMHQPNVTHFIGAVGDDAESCKLLNILRNDSVNVSCQIVSNTETGKCLVLITGVSRTLVTNLGASTLFSYDEFLNSNSLRVIENSAVLYISGYFLRVCSKTVKKSVEIASCKNIPVVFNLNAAWVVESFFNEIIELLPYLDYLIANTLEATAMSKMLRLNTNTDLFKIASTVSKLCPNPEKPNLARHVILTRGSDPIIVAHGEQIRSYSTISVPESEIVDTNSAGDAFAGGFLAGLLKRDSLEMCINCGLWAASEVIRHSGCNFSKEKRYYS